MKSAFVAFAVLAAAACTPVDWAKKDAAAEQAQADLHACEKAAFLVANAVPLPYATMGPVILQDFTGQRFNVYPIGPFADPQGERFVREGLLARECMRKKGYELVPAERK